MVCFRRKKYFILKTGTKSHSFYFEVYLQFPESSLLFQGEAWVLTFADDRENGVSCLVTFELMSKEISIANNYAKVQTGSNYFVSDRHTVPWPPIRKNDRCFFFLAMVTHPWHLVVARTKHLGVWAPGWRRELFFSTDYGSFFGSLVNYPITCSWNWCINFAGMLLFWWEESRVERS